MRLLINSSKISGYIDLSKRRVSAEESALCTENFAKAKTVGVDVQILTFLILGESNTKACCYEIKLRN